MHGAWLGPLRQGYRSFWVLFRFGTPLLDFVPASPERQWVDGVRSAQPARLFTYARGSLGRTMCGGAEIASPPRRDAKNAESRN